MAPIIQHDPDLKRDISHVSDIKGGSGDVESVHADVADNAAAGYVDPTLVISEEEKTRLRRRVHRRILPLLTLAYLCQALDKGTTATSSIMGWLQDINAKGECNVDPASSNIQVRTMHSLRRSCGLESSSASLLQTRLCDVFRLPRSSVSASSSGLW